MDLTTGSRLGPYEIDSRISADRYYCGPLAVKFHVNFRTVPICPCIIFPSLLISGRCSSSVVATHQVKRGIGGSVTGGSHWQETGTIGGGVAPAAPEYRR